MTLEALQLQLMRNTDKAGRAEIAAIVLTMHDCDSAKLLIKHYSTELDVFTLSALQQLAEAADAPDYTH